MLFDNLSESVFSVDGITASSWAGNRFLSGPIASVLTSARLLIREDSPGQARLDLYSDAGGPEPGSFLGSFSSPAVYTGSLGLNDFSASLSLLPNTAYWIVLQGLSGSYEWAWTDSINGAGVGFDTAYVNSDDAGLTWQQTGNPEPFLFSLTSDSGVPEVKSSGALLPLSFLAILMACLVRPGPVSSLGNQHKSNTRA